MRKTPIKSVSDPANPRCWARLVCADGSPDFEVHDLNGLVPFREVDEARNGRALTAQARANLVRARPSAYKGVLAQGPNVLGRDRGKFDSLRPNLQDELHHVLWTVDGDIVFLPSSQMSGFYYAELGWYDPMTKTWTVLEFVEE